MATVAGSANLIAGLLSILLATQAPLGGQDTLGEGMLARIG